MKEVIQWVTDDDLKNIYTAEYWNNINEERKKDWWIEDGNYDRCLNYLNKHLMQEYNASTEYIDNLDKDDIDVLDLAAGIGWTSVLISKLNKVRCVHSVEISKHRIGVLFEHCNIMFDGIGDKIYRYLGSFYDIKLGDNSIDIIYMSQAFHHANAPLKLLIEYDRVLKCGGRIILVGEHYIGLKRIIRRFISNLIKRGKLTFNFYDLFQPDQRLGDHYYRVSDYQFLFKSLGYSLEYKILKNGNVIYIADKS